MTGRDDKMPSVLVHELRGRPSLRRTTSPTMWDIFWYGTVSAYIGPPGMMGDGRGRRKTSENIGKQRKTAEDDTMSSVLVLCSNLSGKFWKDRTDGLPRCEHWFCFQDLTGLTIRNPVWEEKETIFKRSKKPYNVIYGHAALRWAVAHHGNHRNIKCIFDYLHTLYW